MRMSIGPGAAVNVTLAPGLAAGAAAPGGRGAASRSGASPTGPRNTGRPSGAVAVSITRAGTSLARPASDPPNGSHTNVTRVWPPAARSMPVQNRAAWPLVAGSTMALSAFEISGGGPGLGGAVARATSSAV